MMTTKKQNTEFGIVASLAIIVVSLWCKVDLYIFAVITLLVCLLFPKLYSPFSQLWFGLAKVLERMMSKSLLFLIFFFVITPVGMLRKALGKDSLHTGFSKKQKSIFESTTHTYKSENMEKQF